MTRRTDATPEEPPDYLTVDEVAAILRLSRAQVYKLVRKWFATDGREGIPSERHDKQFRISRYVIEARLGGPITWPIPGFHVIEPAPPAHTNSPARATKRIAKADTQPRLFPL
jgi:hypothetical protein